MTDETTDDARPVRRSVEPLAPPPGRFEAVYRESRHRRYQRAVATCGVAGVFLAGLFGGLALGGPRGVRDTIYAAVNFDQPSPSPTASRDTRTSASGVPSGAVHRRKGSRTATTTVTAPPDVVVGPLHGRVVDPGGRPVPDLFVYAGTMSEGSFVPNRTAARTDADGRYSAACDGGLLFVTPWPLNTRVGANPRGTYAPRFVDTDGCTSGTVTTVQPGAVLEGHVRTDVSCAGVELKMWLWLHGNRSISVRLDRLAEGGSYRVPGLPTGTLLIGDHGRTTQVDLVAGQTTRRDIELACPTIVPTPTPEPSTPQPTPSESTSPPPSPTDPAPSTSSSTATTGSSSASPSSSR